MSRLHISESDLRNLVDRCCAREMKSSAYACALNESTDRGAQKRLQEAAMRRAAKNVMRILRESVQGVSPLEVRDGVEKGLADDIIYKARLKSKHFRRPIENSFDGNVEYEFGNGYIIYANVKATVNYNPTMCFGKIVDISDSLECDLSSPEIILADKWGCVVDDPNLCKVDLNNIKAMVKSSLIHNVELSPDRKNRTLLPKLAQQRSADYIPRYSAKSPYKQVRY